MSWRKWHLEHEDGREWTKDELGAYAWAKHEGGHHTEPPDDFEAFACIDEQGFPVIVCGWGDWYVPAAHDVDMKVVRDE